MRIHQVAVTAVFTGLILLRQAPSYGEEMKQLSYSPGAAQRKADAVKQEQQVLLKDLQRMEALLVEKNKAIDVSIAEIKRLRVEHPALVENPFLVAAYETRGWEGVILEGLSGVFIKPVGVSTIVKVQMSDKVQATELFGSRSRGVFSCGKHMCFVLPSSILGAAQTAGHTEG